MKMVAFFASHFVCSLLDVGRANPHEEMDHLEERLADDINELFPPPKHLSRQNQATEWNDEKKRNVGMNLFRSLPKLLFPPGDYHFERLIAGITCPAGTQQYDIVQMEIRKNTTSCGKIPSMLHCLSKEKKFLYYSWIGTLEDNMPKVTIGALCFRSKKSLEKELIALAGANICSQWKYSDTTSYRLPIPSRATSWDRDFVLYNPPTAVDPSSAIKNGLDEAVPDEIPLNPDGRTGITGKGMLKHFGANMMEIPIIVRLNDDTKEILCASELGIEKSLSPLPAFYKSPKKGSVQKKSSSGSPLEEYFYELVRPEYKVNCSTERFRKALKLKRRIFHDNLPHPYTTDNAWIKATIYMVTTRQEPCFNYLDLASKNNYFGYNWKSFNYTTISNVRDLTKTFFSKGASKEITRANYAYAVESFFFLSVAAAIVALVTSAGALIFTIPIAFLFLASVLTFYYMKKLIFMHKPLEAFERRRK